MTVKEKENLLNSLSKMYLKYRNPDKGYFSVFREIKRLEKIGIFLDINDIQNIAYDCCDWEVE